MDIHDITSASYKNEVEEYDGTVLLDFFSERCVPCKKLSPVIEEVAKLSPPEIKICKVDVDREAKLTEKFGIMSIPTLVVMKNGKVKNRSIGVTGKKAILDMLDYDE